MKCLEFSIIILLLLFGPTHNRDFIIILIKMYDANVCFIKTYLTVIKKIFAFQGNKGETNELLHASGHVM